MSLGVIFEHSSLVTFLEQVSPIATITESSSRVTGGTSEESGATPRISTLPTRPIERLKDGFYGSTLILRERKSGDERLVRSKTHKQIAPHGIE